MTQIDNYILASLKYISTEDHGDTVTITNSKIPRFTFTSEKTDKELLILNYKNYLYEWIEDKISKKEFIPLVDRIDLNEERTIKAFDPTKEVNKHRPSDIVTIENIKLKEK